ncbi:hypothetical protein [Pseudotamlana carrageenivorans]|uniref:Uncharacterized protein n=1 Tax=Pseudotamlana carrageenivorans TaxID=2069432 RepID=A0A2I7SKP1_9FLAO|nr:hypothetical protein [Tamlana carrageenivorans]AUS06461.1 hypothetical protein C1A40_13850 [Tamlana carrageenivorans]
MTFRDKNNRDIKDGDAVIFTHEDSVEPTGFNKRVTEERLCFWSAIEGRYIPFKEVYDFPLIKDAERVRNDLNCKPDNQSKIYTKHD